MKLAASFEKFTLLHALREQNEKVNLLSKLASTQKGGNNRSDTILEDIEAAKRLKWEVSKYTLVGENLYRRGCYFLLLKCLEIEEAEYVMQEVHEGVCGSHIGGRTLASKISRANYYLPTLKSDCSQYVKTCNTCQRYVDIHKARPEPLHLVMSPWPFHN
ncbi:hypothetical protein CR513_12310, partial [Mucuna pruriens]